MSGPIQIWMLFGNGLLTTISTVHRTLSRKCLKLWSILGDTKLDCGKLVIFATIVNSFASLSLPSTEKTHTRENDHCIMIILQ